MSKQPKQASDFEAIFHPDGTCTWWECGKPGVVLAYDVMSPECAEWFCAEHWVPYGIIPLLTIVEDKRTQEEGAKS